MNMAHARNQRRLGVSRSGRQPESYELRDKGSFGPGELPHFDRAFFEFPHGRKEDWLFQQLKDRLDDEGVPPAEDLEKFAGKVKDAIERQRNSRGDE